MIDVTNLISVKYYEFDCPIADDTTNFNHCDHCPYASNPRECWAQHVVANIKLDYAISNEVNVADYAICPRCDGKDILALGFSRYLCNNCSSVFRLNRAEQRRYLGKNFLVLDIKALNFSVSEILQYKPIKID